MLGMQVDLLTLGDSPAKFRDHVHAEELTVRAQRLSDYLGHMRQFAFDVSSLVEGLEQDVFLSNKRMQ